MNRYRFFSLPLALLLCLSLFACAGKEAPGRRGAPVYTGPPAMDVLTLPQDLHAYTAAAGGSRALLSRAEQEAAARRQKNALFKPWTLTKPSRWVRQSLDADFNMKLDNGYGENKRPFPPDLWQDLVTNSNKKAYGNGSGPAITLRHTNLRAMPTSGHYYLRPDLPGEGYPFDYFQHSSLPPGTPVYICNVSRDRLWLLVESAVTAGWLPAADVAGTDEAFMNKWRGKTLAALVRDRVDLGGTTAHIGALLPLAGGGGHDIGPSLSVLYPRRASSGKAEAAVADLAPGSAVIVPLPLSPDNVARVGNEMMAQTYGWGGLDEKRDCSALTRDIMAPFGIFLPRHSARQARTGLPVNVAGLGNDEKEQTITREAAPFRSLVWLRGHIGLYLGVYEGKAVMYHNMWGVRTRDAAGGCDGRAIVGKAVVTTLRPGAERPDLCSPGSLLDRIERAVVLP